MWTNDDHEPPKPLQDPDDPDLERGDYVDDHDGQDAIWAEAEGDDGENDTASS